MSDAQFFGPSVPASKAVAITPDDSEDIGITRGIYVAASGDLTVIMADDSEEVTFTDIAAGVVHPLRVKRVLDTGTDATGIIGLY